MLYPRSRCEVVSYRGRDVLAVVDENGSADGVYQSWVESVGHYEVLGRIPLSGREYCEVEALVAEKRPGTAFDGQAIARTGPLPVKAKKRKRAKREDDRLRAPEGRRYEDV